MHSQIEVSTKFNIRKLGNFFLAVPLRIFNYNGKRRQPPLFRFGMGWGVLVFSLNYVGYLCMIKLAPVSFQIDIADQSALQDWQLLQFLVLSTLDDHYTRGSVESYSSRSLQENVVDLVILTTLLQSLTQSLNEPRSIDNVAECGVSRVGGLVDQNVALIWYAKYFRGFGWNGSSVSLGTLWVHVP